MIMIIIFDEKTKTEACTHTCKFVFVLHFHLVPITKLLPAYEKKILIKLDEPTNSPNFPIKSTGILHLWISDGDGNEVVGSLVLFLFFLLPLCVLLAIHPSPTVSLPLSLLLI